MQKCQLTPAEDLTNPSQVSSQPRMLQRMGLPLGRLCNPAFSGEWAHPSISASASRAVNAITAHKTTQPSSESCSNA